VNARAAPGRKRVLCVGRGERCFVCGGRERLEPTLRHSAKRPTLTWTCPVCRGRGRAIVVDSGEGRRGLLGRPS
jgi:hypothetical protein